MTAGLVTWRRRAAWIGLFGLLLQIAVSFAHVHLLSFQPDGSTVVTLDDGAGGAPSPQKSPAAPDQDHCPVCLALQLAGTFVVPYPIGVAAPTVVSVVPLGREDSFELSPPKHLLFRTRAPPIV
jgi:hypothetical protein